MAVYQITTEDGMYEIETDEPSQPEAPQKASGLSVEQATDLGASTSPQSLLQAMSPSNLLPGVGVARQSIMENTGIDPTNIIDPIPNMGQALKALQNPLETGKKVWQGIKRGGEAALDPEGFKPTAKEAPVVRGGKIAGTALDLAAMPVSGPAKGGIVDRASETMDSIARVSEGTSFKLIQDPSKWFKIFASKRGVEEAYNKAEKAGESIHTSLKNRSFQELTDEALDGAAATIKDLTKEVAPMVEGAAVVHTPTLIRFRKTLNNEIERLQRTIESGLRQERSNNVAVARSVRYQELAHRVNSVLDKVAPKFREADALHGARKSMVGFRQGLLPLAVGSTNAALGLGLQQGFRAMGAAAKLPQATYSDALELMASTRRKKRKK